MRRRLSLLVLAVTSMVVIAFVAPLAVLVQQQAENRALAHGQRTAQAVASGLAVAAALAPEMSAGLVDIVVAASGEGVTSVFLADGTVSGAPATFSEAAAQARTGQALSAAAEGGVEILVPVTALPGTLVVRTWVPDEELRRGVGTAWLLLGLLGILLIAAAAALADRLAANLVRPVTALAGAARRMASGDLTARVAPEGPPEIADAGHAFNHLAGRLHDVVTAERESLADLSHRLRTPLTALRLQAESLPGGEGLVEDVDRLSRQVDALITEARRGSPADGPRRADLCRAAADRAAFWQVLAEEQGRVARCEVPPGPIWVGLTEDELGAAIDTLLENVFTHTAPGTGYAVTVLAPLPGRAVLRVEDEGPGFPHHGVAARGASEAGSSGLGLDIARAASRRTGGDLTLGERPGGGARVEAAFGRI